MRHPYTFKLSGFGFLAFAHGSGNQTCHKIHSHKNEKCNKCRVPAAENSGNKTTDYTGKSADGRLEVSDIVTLDETIDENMILYLAGSAEAKSEHPLGKAITAFAKKKEIALTESAEFKMTMGKGIFAEIDSKKNLCGNEKFLMSCGIILPDNLNTSLAELRSQGKASILVAKDGRCIGVIAFSDVLRSEASEMVSKLSAMQTKTVLLTGDNQQTADYFAGKVGITGVRSELLPEEKVNNIVRLQAENRNVCMIGDGVNDAPALKTASVGVAMGSMGSDIAV